MSRDLPVRIRDQDEPRTETEHLLQQIWIRYLPGDTIGIDDDFFAAGGSSLGAAQVLAAVQQQWGVRLSLRAMAERPNVAHLATLLRTGRGSARGSLLPLRVGGSQPTVVFVHPLGGGVLWYRFLAQLLPAGVRCLGARAAGLDPDVEPHRDVPAMAAHYLAELDAVCPPDQLLLAGYSFGGLVAYEMAHQLEQAGHPPRGIAVLDPALSDGDHPAPERARLLWSLVGHAMGLSLDVAELAELPADQLIDRLLAAGMAQGVLPADLGRGRLARLVEIYPINAEALRRYRLPTYHGTVDLLCAGLATPEPWRRRCPGLRVHDIPGDHLDLLSRENAPAVMAVLASRWFETSDQEQ